MDIFQIEIYVFLKQKYNQKQNKNITKNNPTNSINNIKNVIIKKEYN